MSGDTEVKTQKWTVEHDADGDFVIFEHTEIVAITNSDTPKDEVRALLISKAPEMADLLRRLYQLIDAGILVRNTSDDGAPDWAMKQFPLVSTLAELKALLTTLEKI